MCIIGYRSARVFAQCPDDTGGNTGGVFAMHALNLGVPVFFAAFCRRVVVYYSVLGGCGTPLVFKNSGVIKKR
jgi:hypothetical protein